MLAGLFRLSFFLLRNFFACEFSLCAVVLNSCFLKRFIDQPPLSFVELIFFSLKIPPRKDGILPLESEDTFLCKPIDWSMAAMLRDSVVVVVVRTRPRAIPLAMIAIRKILHGFPFPSRDAYGALLGGPSGRRSSAIMKTTSQSSPYTLLTSRGSTCIKRSMQTLCKMCSLCCFYSVYSNILTDFASS